MDHDELAFELTGLLDRWAPTAAETIDLSGAASYDAAQLDVDYYFREHPGVDAATVILAGVSIGVVSRRSLARSQGTAADSNVGTGERLELTVDSTQYRLLVFVCPDCGTQDHRIFYDPRDLPRCAGHGEMALRR
ncbi:hypothetical protein [Paractinoplanes maris]|uniref:hypothetical protein n=1 Tax=Paractinoplanes maris TaxID=1734446 RepID=UPI002020648D|nr:hypothetical protein [Actinoplanes maris]